MFPIIELPISSSSRYHLSTVFVWPPPKEEIQASKWFYFKAGVMLFLSFVTLFIPVSISFYFTTKNNLDGSEHLGQLFAYSGMLPIMLFTLTNYQKLFHLIVDLCNFERFGKPPNFDKVNKKLNIFANLSAWYCLIATFLYNCANISVYSTCQKERSQFQICGSIIPLWVPWAPVKSWYLVLLHSMYAFVYSMILTKGGLFYSLQVFEIAINIKLKIDHLNLMMTRCFDGEEKNYKKRLQSCIQYHQRIINFSEQLNSGCGEQTFAHLAATAVSCGGLTNQILKHDVQAILHCFGWIVSAFVVTLAGQVLMDASVSVADGAYNSNWIKANSRLRKDLQMIILRSQKPLLLKAGSLQVLSLSLFVAIMKFSYSVMTLMN